MRIDKDKLKLCFEKKAVSSETVCCYAGITARELDWILKNGFVQVETAERLAVVAGVEVQDIVLQNGSKDAAENVIEFLKDQEQATVTFTQKRYITRIRRLAAAHPEECRIIVENKDGSIVAHIPVSWVRINPTRELSESQAEISRQNLLKARNAGA